MIKEYLKRIIGWIRKFVREKLHSENEDLPYYITIVTALIIFVVGLNAFIDITRELFADRLNPFDTLVTDYVLNFRSETVTTILTFITNIGDQYGYFVAAASLGAFFFIKHRSWKFVLQTLAVLILSTLSNVVLKQVIGRERPSIEHLVTVTELSYPSGHAMGAMAFYGFLIYLSVRYVDSVLLKILFVLVLISLILGIGISRIYLGVHYPSDVAAGFIGGLMWVTFCIIVFDVISLLRRRKTRYRIQNNNSAGSDNA